MKPDTAPDGGDRSLVERARGGDRGAFDLLAVECRDSLERHIRMRIGSYLGGCVDPEDVLQETYARAWKSIGGFRGSDGDAILRWLRGISEHAILDFVSRQKRGEVFYVPDTDDRAHSQPSPSKVLRREERFSRLEEALKGLPPEYREVLQLVRIEGLKIREAAERMNRTPNAVMKLLARALKKLKEAFGSTESLHLPPRRLDGRGEDRHDDRDA